MSQAEAVSKTYTKPPKLFKFGSLGTLIKEIGEEQAVLDVGCSEGYLAQYTPNNKVWGIDGNNAAVAKAKESCVDVKLMDLNTIPSQPVFSQKFDVIVFADVLEHLLYPEQVLRHFKRYLKPDGKVLVSLPNVALWRVRLNLLIGRFNYTDYGVLDRTHVHLYTFKTAADLLTSAGFRVSSLRGAANLLGPVVAYVPLLRPLLSIHVIVTANA